MLKTKWSPILSICNTINPVQGFCIVPMQQCARPGDSACVNDQMRLCGCHGDTNETLRGSNWLKCVNEQVCTGVNEKKKECWCGMNGDRSNCVYYYGIYEPRCPECLVRSVIGYFH